MMKKVIVIITICLFVFVSCDSNSDIVKFPDGVPTRQHDTSLMDEKVENPEDVEFVYELKRLTIDEDDIFFNNALHDQSKATVYDDQIFLYTIEGYADDKTETLHVFGTDGTPIMEYAIADDSSGLMNHCLRQVFDTEQKQLIGIEENHDDKVHQYYCIDPDGNIVMTPAITTYENEHNGWGYFSSVDASLFFMSYINDLNQLYFITHELEVTGPFQPSASVIAALRLDDGRVIAVCENGECMLYDEETQKLTGIRLYEETEAWNKAEQILYGEDGGVYFINGDSITVQRNGEDTLLCDFDKSYLSLDAMQFIDVLSEDRFLIWYHNPLTGEEYPAILAPTDAAERPMRQLVRVASIGTSARLSNEMVRTEMIYASIAHFNMTNDEYFIELTDFDSLAEIDQNGNRIPGDTSSIRDRLFEDALLAGEKYDVYLIGSSFDDREMLVEKGLFLDITSYAERKNLIACVRDAMTQNGKITGIPFSVELSTLVTSTDILPAGSPFTYDKLFEIYETLEDGQALFCDYTGREMRQSAMYDFIDFENQNCTFDSAAFAQVFGFLADYEAAAYDGKALSDTPSAYLNHTVGSFSGHAQGVTAYGDIMEAFATGDIKFLKLDIGAPDALSSMLYFFEMIGKDYNLCGYPSADGGTVTVSTPMLMSVGADSDNISGAYAYLNLLLSDTLQTQDAMFAFPVTQSAVETRLTWGVQYYYLAQESGMYTTRNYGSALRIQFGTASKAGLDSMKASYYDASLNVLKPDMLPLHEYICNSTMRGASDTVIRSIIEDELSYVSQGVRTAGEAGKIIQSRVWIYLNE